MYDGIIFDIDGTLWDSRKVVADSWNAALAEQTDYDVRFDYEKIGKLFGKPAVAEGNKIKNNLILVIVIFFFTFHIFKLGNSPVYIL